MSNDLRGPNYRSAEDLGLVPARKPATISRMEPHYIEPEPKRVIQSSKPTVAGSHRDKAEGFLLSVLPLSGALAVAVAFLAVSLGLVPVLSVWMLAIIFTVFSVTMVAAYATNQIVSPDGVGLMSEKWRHQRLLDNQKFMQEQFRERYRDEQ